MDSNNIKAFPHLLIKQYLLLFLSIILFPLQLHSQNHFSLSGRITDQSTGEYLIGASVISLESGKGVTTNSYGFYSITLPEGINRISWAFIGYDEFKMEIDIAGNRTLNVELVPSIIRIGEISVKADRSNERLRSVNPGIERIEVGEIRTLPVFFGEKDVLKSIQLLPGISSLSEGGAGLVIRGGPPGHTLVLLDEAPVYNPSHLMGFFSIFNSDIIKDVSIYKGGIPAEFGGRASSVIDISMNNGNSKKPGFSGGIGLISSRIVAEAPIKVGKSSFIISARRTYADVFARLILPEHLIRDDMKFYFYDVNGKVNMTLNDKNRVYISNYFGKDLFHLGKDIGTEWGNATTTLRWNHLFNDRVFSNATIAYSRYNYGFVFGQNSLRLRSGIEDIRLAEDVTWYINSENTLKSGLELISHQFLPGELSEDIGSEYSVILKRKSAIEGAAYLQNEQKFTRWLTANYGVRLSGFFQTGPGWFYSYTEENELADSVFYNRGEIAYPVIAFEPRLSVNWETGRSSSLKASYNRLVQYIHLLSNTTSGSPTDVWLPSSNNLSPVYSDNYSTGFFMDIKNRMIGASIEIYYKSIRNATDYRDGADIVFNEYSESQIMKGIARGYGIELFLRKKDGRFTGWISYTLARTENRINGINNGKWYPAKYDRTHDVSLVANWRLYNRLTLSGVWVYATGNAVTFPSGRYEIGNMAVPYYTERNGYRMPAYHRLDLSLTIDGKAGKKFRTSWDLSVFNLYNRHNAYMITFRESAENHGSLEAVKLSLFGIVPSIGMNFNF